MEMPAITVGASETIHLGVTIGPTGRTAHVTIRDFETQELLGMAVRELGPFDKLEQIWAALWERCPRQLPFM